MTNLILIATITAYSWTSRPCADGSWPRVGVCAAPRSVPMHSHVLIDGKAYIVVDRLNKRYTNTWDIYFPTKQEAINFGKRTLEVRVLK